MDINDERIHWFVRRTYDPIGKLLYDLSYLQFRRSLLLAMTSTLPETHVCVHSNCRTRFDNVEFFGQPGSHHPIYEVADKKEAAELGASGYICLCPRDSDSITHATRRFNNIR